MKDYQKAFIQLALKCQALKFGQFELKSGRISPYFFNAGEFKTGAALAELGDYYAAALMDAGASFDMIFGPAYKGIPLASAMSVSLAKNYGKDLPFAFNRKEAKTHGEGGNIVGAKLQGGVAIVDDVITAGTAIREVLSMLKDGGAHASAIIVGLDRQERGKGELSAIQEIEQETGVPVISIIKLTNIMEYLASQADGTETLKRVEQYRKDYGV